MPTDDGAETLAKVIETLAPLERRAGSPAEKQAAEWIVGRLEEAGASDARIEEVDFLDGYAPLIAGLCAVAAGAATAGFLSRKACRPAAVAALAAAALIADDVSNGPRLARNAVQKPKKTWNVVAEAGDRAAERTLVVMAHHDAAPTGLFFDQSTARKLIDRFPGLLDHMDTTFPNWWLTLAGPVLAAAGSIAGRRGMIATGGVLAATSAAALADIARSPIVPGANDNLTAVAVLIGMAERLRERPVEGLRVRLVSLGAEEVCQGGIYGFGARHFPELDPESTWFLNVDTVGSPHLVLMEGEGTVVMEDYRDSSFRDLIASVADQEGIELRRGMRWRNSTDAVIPNRAGFRIATLTSVNRYKVASNYHQMSDTPDNVEYATVGAAVDLADALARKLASVKIQPPAG